MKNRWENEGSTYKIAHIWVSECSGVSNLIWIDAKTRHVYPMTQYANILIYIFINIDENRDRKFIGIYLQIYFYLSIQMQ